MVAFLRSREIGEGKITPGVIKVLARFQINGSINITLTTTTRDQQVRLIGFPPRAEINITYSQLWLVPSPSSTLADRIIWLALIAANESETTLQSPQFFARFIDLMAVSQQLEGTAGSFQTTIHEGRQIWVDEIYNTLGGVALESVEDGLYLYGQTTTAEDVAVDLVGRIHAEILFHQMNYADDYTQDGKKFDEGWAGYEWEEAVGDAMELGTVDEAL